MVADSVAELAAVSVVESAAVLVVERAVDSVVELAVQCRDNLALTRAGSNHRSHSKFRSAAERARSVFQIRGLRDGLGCRGTIRGTPRFCQRLESYLVSYAATVVCRSEDQIASRTNQGQHQAKDHL